MPSTASPRTPPSSARSALLVVALLTALSTVGRTQETAAAEAASLVLRPGDAVKLDVWMEPALNGEYIVAPDGTLAHPAFPMLRVAGMPLSRVQAVLDSAARGHNTGARIVMQPLLRVIIDGEVRSPSLYRYPAGTSIAEALVQAGGRTDRADMRKVTLFRDGQERRFDLTDPAGPASRIAVASGDQLIVGRRSSFRDSIVPFTTIVGTVASVATLIIRSGR